MELVREEGLEPPTSRFQGASSSQLKYSLINSITPCSGGKSRTFNLRVNSALLDLLSYTGARGYAFGF